VLPNRHTDVSIPAMLHIDTFRLPLDIQPDKVTSKPLTRKRADMTDHPGKQGTAMRRLLLLGVITMTGISCGDDPVVGPTEGTLLIAARTTGEDMDQNGYLVSVNSSQGQPIGLGDTLYVAALEPGSYVVSLTGMAENCSVPEDENPQTADVVAADTAEVLFDITCDLIETGGGGNPAVRGLPGQ
jgi:hypothetical protein